MHAPSDQLLYKPAEAARVLSYSRSIVYELMASGELPFVERRGGRRIRRSDLEAFVNNLEPQAN